MSTGPLFARHETFHPRYGWLEKGFDEAETDPGIFIASDVSLLMRSPVGRADGRRALGHDEVTGAGDRPVRPSCWAARRRP